MLYNVSNHGHGTTKACIISELVDKPSWGQAGKSWINKYTVYDGYQDIVWPR